MFRQSIQIRDNRITHVLEQENRAAILRAVQSLREAPPADRPGLGRWALSVPLEDHAALVRKYPDLAATDGQIRSQAWARFIQSDESIPYRMRDRI